jgi:hypothetical protein
VAVTEFKCVFGLFVPVLEEPFGVSFRQGKLDRDVQSGAWAPPRPGRKSQSTHGIAKIPMEHVRTAHACCWPLMLGGCGGLCRVPSAWRMMSKRTEGEAACLAGCGWSCNSSGAVSKALVQI